MRSAFLFCRRHGYEFFVTLLVLALGAVTHHLRTAQRAAPVSAAATPVPVPAAAVLSPTPVPEPVWLRPVSGGILTPYSGDLPCWNADMDCWQIHAAVDLSADAGEPVRAAADGVVHSISDDPLLGHTVVLSHRNGWQTVYASLGKVACRAGQAVRAGDAIAAAGNSADSEATLNCHLHFELLQEGVPVKPVFAP